MYVVYNPHVGAQLHLRADRFATHRTRIAAAVGIYLFVAFWRQQAAVIATVLRRPMAGQIAFACKLFVAPVAGMPRL